MSTTNGTIDSLFTVSATMSTDASNVVARPADEHADVFFPPHELADFVIHYNNSHFHVHKFVLHHHSAYFNAYFRTLTNTASSSSPSSDDAQLCKIHPQIAHCIHLPQQARLAGGEEVDADDFCLFLCHLYFSSHYCYPPYLPLTDVDLDGDSPPLSQTFPPITSLDFESVETLRCSDGEYEFNESLLTLAHYFDCAAMMAQCEIILLKQLEYGERTGDHVWLVEVCFLWLPVADRYRLSKQRKACIHVLAADRGLLQRKEYQRAKQTWDRSLMADLMEAALMTRDDVSRKRARKK